MAVSKQLKGLHTVNNLTVCIGVLLYSVRLEAVLYKKALRRNLRLVVGMIMATLGGARESKIIRDE